MPKLASHVFQKCQRERSFILTQEIWENRLRVASCGIWLIQHVSPKRKCSAFASIFDASCVNEQKVQLWHRKNWEAGTGSLLFGDIPRKDAGDIQSALVDINCSAVAEPPIKDGRFGQQVEFGCHMFATFCQYVFRGLWYPVSHSCNCNC